LVEEPANVARFPAAMGEATARSSSGRGRSGCGKCLALPELMIEIELEAHKANP
jgi:hypothetical protein